MVVVDTNSLINNVPLVGDVFVTVSEVLDEVRDVEARRRLETTLLTTRIETRVPSKEALQRVVAFATATGDIAVLSAADIKLIAVTRMIELEMHGETNLRAAPAAQATVFSKPKGAEEEVPEGEEEEEERDDFYDNVREEGEAGLEEGHEHETPSAVPAPEAAKPSSAKVATSSANESKVSLPGWGDEWVVDAAQLEVTSTSDVAKEAAVEDGSSVACLTADFAMQNVLLQMGLRVLSPDGRRITRAKQWALRCFSCFKITRDMGKLFCPQCGNNTLKRVSISVDAQGSVMAFFNPKNKISKRGSKFPLPKPVGGRAPVFITDECELPKVKQKSFKKETVTEYGFGDSRNRVAERPRVAYGKKNPNESKKRTDKKKKKHAQ